MGERKFFIYQKVVTNLILKSNDKVIIGYVEVETRKDTTSYSICIGSSKVMLTNSDELKVLIDTLQLAWEQAIRNQEFLNED